MQIYCINLVNRTDRRENAQAEFDKQNLIVEFFPATDGRIDTPDGIFVYPAEYGCTDSHVRIWKDIVEKNHDVALVLEDDVFMVDNFESKLKIIIDEVKNIDWDLIHLGPIIPIEKKMASKSLYWGESLGTHAYVINLKCAQKISQFDSKIYKSTVDFQLNKFPLNILCSLEILVKQENIDDHPLVGLFKSTFNGDIGLNRTIGYDYFFKKLVTNYNLTTKISILILIILIIFGIHNLIHRS
jgi:GR25 family glycosyltransferase involved in LPS biosynthesis